jgi:hypothetical protein
MLSWQPNALQQSVSSRQSAPPAPQQSPVSHWSRTLHAAVPQHGWRGPPHSETRSAPTSRREPSRVPGSIGGSHADNAASTASAAVAVQCAVDLPSLPMCA